MATVVRGLTWDHPRAWQGLLAVTDAFNKSRPDIELRWERHSLRGFEAAPIEQIAQQFDLVTFDHPFVGDAVQAGCLLDLSEFSSQLDLAALASDSAGASHHTYAYENGQWALAVDAACQTAVARPDLLAAAKAAPPESLEDAVRFGERHGLGLALAVPHAFMNYLTICSLLGADISGSGDRLIDPDVAPAALELHRRLAACTPRAALSWSSIGLLQAMATTDEVAWSPMVFCFNTYARPDRSAGLRKLEFLDVPGLRGARGGPVIGGAGLAISAFCKNADAAVTALGYLLSGSVQIEIARAGGQPGRASAWLDESADAANGSFFTGCWNSLSKASIRPRYPGYIGLQEEAGKILLDDASSPGLPARAVVDRIEAAHRKARQNGMRRDGSS